MAIKGSYTWRGIELPEAYVRIVNVIGNPREGFSLEFCIYSSQEFAADPDNRFKMMQGRQLRIENTNPTTIFQDGYATLKALPELSHFVDC